MKLGKTYHKQIRDHSIDPPSHVVENRKQNAEKDIPLHKNLNILFQRFIGNLLTFKVHVLIKQENTKMTMKLQVRFL